MRNRSWGIPGFLVLIMLLLVSFPGMALAEDTAQPGTGIHAGPAVIDHYEPAVEEPVVEEPVVEEPVVEEPVVEEPVVEEPVVEEPV
ncbi:hypothetical protein, partial [Phosphitispora fastidiosa]|uniref:hypothetical protein n=1 Tax=Phosphitispora fastidiosa TaxID=2837202 RepID=UPI001E485365